VTSTERKPCDKVAYATSDQAARTIELCLRAAMLGNRDGHEVAAVFCAEHQAFHLTSRPSRDDAPLVRR
jgi:hypothetical protein